MPEANLEQPAAAPSPRLPGELVHYLNACCTQQYNDPCAVRPGIRLKTIAGMSVPEPNPVCVIFTPKPPFIAQMESMRRLAHEAGVSIGKPNLIFWGESKIRMLEDNDIPVNRSRKNNRASLY